MRYLFLNPGDIVEYETAIFNVTIAVIVSIEFKSESKIKFTAIESIGKKIRITSQEASEWCYIRKLS